MADLTRHRIDIQRAIADGVAGRDEIFQHLMGLPPEERAKMSPAVFARLTEGQLRQLLGEVEAKSPIANLPSPAGRRPKPSRFYMAPMPPVRTALAMAIAVALLGGTGISAFIESGVPFGSPIVRSVRVDGWPDCPRLAPDVDGCVYAVERGISLAQAAGHLDMPVTALQAVNRDLSAPFAILPARTLIVVWRGDGVLTK